MNKINQELIDFIHSSPTAFHAVANTKTRLIEDGYTELFESGDWELCEGGKYFVTRADSSLIAFRIPEADFDGYQIAASHTDSPSFKLKPDFESASKGYLNLSVDKYGGAVLTSWLDRPLWAAGRLMVKEGGRIDSRLVCTDSPVAVIPSLAPHISKGESIGIKDMTALVGHENDRDSLIEELAEAAETSKDSILSHDLYLVNNQRGSVWGKDNAFISAPRLDDLQCVFSSLVGFLLSGDEINAPVLAIFDREEVGSESSNGAASMFLPDTLKRISLALGKTDAEHFKMLSNTFLISADNAHAIHPVHPEASDADNSAALNSGIAIKHNAMGRYVTDAESEAVIKALCRNSAIPSYDYTNRSDIPGGSTLGHILQTHLSVSAVDIGIGQLAMHSSFETAGAKDTEYACELFSSYFNSHIYKKGNTFVIEN